MNSAKRIKKKFDVIDLQKGLELSSQLFDKNMYFETFDLLEQLLEYHSKQYLQILETAYLYYIRMPQDRYNLYQGRLYNFNIKSGDKVLDIGSGNVPFPLATHLADLAIHDHKYGRAGEPFKYIQGLPVYECNIEKMPFADKEFDFVYCSHVMEHVHNPDAASKEMMRIAKRGFIESPTKAKDLWYNNAAISNHLWYLETEGQKLIFNRYSSEEIKGLNCDVMKDMHINPQSSRERALHALIYLKADLVNTMLYWENSFDYEVREIPRQIVMPKHIDAPTLFDEQLSTTTKKPHITKPKLSVVTIVLNGMPFIEYSIRAVYDYVHEIIIIEGAVESCMFAANPDGSSKDGTVELINNFPDPLNKLKFIRGSWREKLDMHNKALEYITGDYIWLIDSDEVYKQSDIEKIIELLSNDSSITQINFIPDNFWKGFDYIFVSDEFFGEEVHYRRIFKFNKGCRFINHRPPTLFLPDYKKHANEINLVSGEKTRELGIIPFHYSYILDEQVRQKIELYNSYGWGSSWNLDLNEWFANVYKKWTPENRNEIEKIWGPWTGNKYSKTQKYNGNHPEVIQDFIKSFNHYTNSNNEIMTHLINAIFELKIRFGSRINAIETGTIRSFDEKHESTRHLSIMLGSNGFLTSVDLSYEAISIAKAICNNPENVRWIESDSLSFLKSLTNEKFHFALLDSANDKELIFEEFKLILPLITENGIIIIDDAGIKSDNTDYDLTVEAQKGHLVWKFLNAINAEFEILQTPRGHGTQLKLTLTKQNIEKLYRGLDVFKKKSIKNGIKIAGEDEPERDLTAVSTHSEFQLGIDNIFKEIKPSKIIETGTYLGTGTTSIIADAIRKYNLSNSRFYSIEVNARNLFQAEQNLKSRGLIGYVKLKHGLSVPRSMLPSINEIQHTTVDNIEFDNIFVDHMEQERALLYFRETDFSNVEDDLLGKCLAEFDFSPDFVLLDSAGHIGFIEFSYLIEKLKNHCYIALDDIFHIKHHKSYRFIQSDPRFEIIISSKEKFGFCITKFTPESESVATHVSLKLSKDSQFPNDNTLLSPDKHKNILWIRTDSIGDNILSAPALKYIKDKLPDSSISVVCQEHISELYETCPYVESIITFDRKKIFADDNYRKNFVDRLKLSSFDLVLNSVYSREPLTDFLCVHSGAKEIFAHYGDLSNISQIERDSNNHLYTKLINSPGEYKNELQRHRDFLKGFGIEEAAINPTVWLTNEDEQFADSIFKANNLQSDKTVVLFAGAQYDVRRYEYYGTAISEFCKEKGLSIIALGSGSEYEINQINLKQAEVPSLNLSGKTTLRQSAAIIKKAGIAIGAETGLAHIACAVGKPNVILLGGGHFGRFMPYSKLTTIVCLPLDCYRCNWQCKYETTYCIKNIDKQVIAKAFVNTFENNSDKPRIFIQAENLWENRIESPKYKSFDKFLNVTEFELTYIGKQSESEAVQVSKKTPSISLIEKTEILDEKSTPIDASLKQPYKKIIDNLKQKPNSEELINLFAEMKIEQGKYDEALLILLDLVSEKPEFAKALNNLGVCFWQLGELENSLKYFNAALKLNPLDKILIMNICDVFVSIGKVHDAIDIYRKYLEKNPLDNEIKAELETLIDSVTEKEFDIGVDVEKSHLTDDIKTNHTGYQVTAIVSTYNSEQFIGGCIADLVNQTLYKKNALQIVVVNSGSKQGEDNIIKQYQEKYFHILYINTDERETVYKAWNRAIKASSGKYLTNANTDDRRHENALELMAKHLDDNPDIALVYADQLITNVANDTFITTQALKKWNWPDYSYNELQRRCMVGSQPMWRKSLHDKYGYFRDDMFSAGDYEFWLRIARTEKFARLPLVLGLYYENPNGLQYSSSHSETETLQIWKDYDLLKPEIQHYPSIPVPVSPNELDLIKKNILTKPSIKDIDGISVIIPCFNHSEFLPDAVESVLNQTYKNWEIIIVNDASTDNSKQVAENLISALMEYNIRLINLETNSGQAKARNIGISRSTFDLILPLDADDKLHPQFIEKCLNILKQNPELSIVYTDVQEFGSLNRIIPSIEYNFDTLRIFNYITSTALFKKEIWKATGGYNESMRGAYEDWDFWISCGEKGYRGKRIPEPLFYYRKLGTGSYQQSILNDDIIKARIINNHLLSFSKEQRAWADSVLAGKNPIGVSSRLGQIPQIAEAPESNISKINLEQVNKKKRILMTMFGWNESGSATVLPKSLALNLDKRKFEIAVLYAGQTHNQSNEPYYLDKKIENGLHLYGIYNRESVYLDEKNPEREISNDNVLRIFRKIVDEFKPDLIHYNNFLGFSFAIANESKRNNIPSIYTPYNYHFIDPSLYMIRSDLKKWNGTNLFENSELLEKYPGKALQYEKRQNAVLDILNNSISLILAGTAQMKEILIQFGVEPNNIIVVHQIPESIKSISSNKNKSYAPSKPIRFAFIGSVLPHKGVHLLIKAIQQITTTDATFDIYGFITEEYLKYLKSLDLKNKIHFKGEYKPSDLNKIASNTDVFILTSLWEESCPIALIECLALNRPIVAPRIGGYPDFIIDGFNGRLYKHDSEFEMIKAIKEILINTQLLLKWQKNSYFPLLYNDLIEYHTQLYEILTDRKVSQVKPFLVKEKF